ncbi:hypothetical protein PAEPH01_2137 [Pancytospora epiphaga]|nr:hypothetical protein PAEPH01_2137 [Pancytospora epiphaga]
MGALDEFLGRIARMYNESTTGETAQFSDDTISVELLRRSFTKEQLQFRLAQAVVFLIASFTGQRPNSIASALIHEQEQFTKTQREPEMAWIICPISKNKSTLPIFVPEHFRSISLSVLSEFNDSFLKKLHTTNSFRRAAVVETFGMALYKYR